VQKTVHRKRIPAWLRWIGWLGFGLLSLAFMLVVARWWVMRSGHLRTLELVQQSRSFSPISKSSSNAVVTGASFSPNAQKGISLANLPYFGPILTGGEEEWKAFEAQAREMRAFMWHGGDHPEMVDGLRSFRALLQNMGTEIPESMTEAEAAAEVLKRADKFSDLLAKWREIVAMGPLDPGGEVTDWRKHPEKWRFSFLASGFESFLTTTSEAHLCVGNGGAAWADLETLRSSMGRHAGLFPKSVGNEFFRNPFTFRLAGSGLRYGLWSDDQLAELSSAMAGVNALESARMDQELEKEQLAQYYNRFDEHKNEVDQSILSTPSPMNRMFNRLALELTTEKQIQDNLALMQSRVDQRLACFDPETGYYVRPTAEEVQAAEQDRTSSDLSGSLYFIYSRVRMGDGPIEPWAARSVIRQQAQYDQFRLAAALETYQRRTGDYPDDLNAISNQFPSGVPRDIATGQPYFYQRGEDGFKLWSTGIDGTSEGGDKKSDVTWTHRPLKKSPSNGQ
jgi:hypothetical protein